MTATPSPKSKSPLWINFRAQLREKKKFLTIISVLQLLGLPLILIGTMCADLDVDGSVSNSVLFVMIGFFALGIACLIGAAMAFKSFPCLHQKSTVDMMCSLPMSTKQRFWSNLLSGLFLYLVPLLGGIVLFCLIWWGSCGLSSTLRADFTPVVFGMVMQAFGCMIVGLVSLFVFIVLVCTCCGTMAESLLNAVVLVSALPITITVVCEQFFSTMYGVDVTSTMMDLLCYAGPVGAPCFFFSKLEYWEDAAYIPMFAFCKWTLLFLAINAAVLALAFWLYCRRKAEDTSKPYVYKLLYYIDLSLVTFCLMSSVYENLSMLTPVLLFTGIIYLLAEVVTNRGFKKFHWSILRYAATAVASLLIMGLVNLSDGFGVEKKVPDVDSVKSVTVCMDPVDFYGDVYERNTGKFVYPGYNDYSGFNGFVLTDPEDIEKIVAEHESILNRHEQLQKDEDYESDYRATIMFSLVYRYKLGGTLKRSYEISWEDWLELTTVQDGAEGAKVCTSVLRQVLDEEEEDFDIGGRLNLTTIELNLKSYPGIIEELCMAYEEDYTEMPYQELVTPEKLYCYLGSVPIRQSFVRTIAVLDKYEITPPSIEAEMGAFHESDNRIYDLGILYPAQRGYTDSSAGSNSYHQISMEGVRELAKYAVAIHYTKEPCYALWLGNQHYAIYAEYREQVEACIKKYATEEGVEPPETEIISNATLGTIMQQYDDFDAFAADYEDVLSDGYWEEQDLEALWEKAHQPDFSTTNET